VPYKPYVKELFSPEGVQILRDAPRDHLHHHALMYAITVEGVNFWEEFRAPGLQRHQRFVSFAFGSRPHIGLLKETLSWENPRAKELLLNEERSIGIFLTEKPKATVLTWRSKLSLPSGKKKVTLEGSHYHGLGMRFVASMDREGTFINESGDLGQIYRGTERLGKAAWCAYISKISDNWVTVAMFGHPSNIRGKPLFFTMTKPFAYLSATLGLYKEPLVLKGKQSLQLIYGVAVLDGKAEKAEIEALYRLWLREISKEK